MYIYNAKLPVIKDHWTKYINSLKLLKSTTHCTGVFNKVDSHPK